MLLFAVPAWLESLADTLGTDASTLIGYAVRILGIVLLAWIAVAIVNVIATRIVHAVDDGNDMVTSHAEKRGRTISGLVRGVGRVVIVAAAFLLSIDVFMDIGPILAAAGILGLAFSFGAQSLVKDVITGFFMLIEDQFAVGDIVEVAGKSGVIEKITLRVVTLRDVAGVLHIIPNGEIKMVSNKTRGWSRAVLDIGVGYGEDVDRVLEVFRDEAARFSTDTEWVAQLDGDLEVWGVESLDDSAVVIRVIARTQPGAQFVVGREFRRRIKNRLDAEDIEIPFPQRTVHVRVEGKAAEELLSRSAEGGAA